MATVLDAHQNATPAAPLTEHEPAPRLPNLVALLRRRAESATDAPVGRIPPRPDPNSIGIPDAYAAN
jgi:hypothetical protein